MAVLPFGPGPSVHSGSCAEGAGPFGARSQANDCLRRRPDRRSRWLKPSNQRLTKWPCGPLGRDLRSTPAPAPKAPAPFGARSQANEALRAQPPLEALRTLWACSALRNEVPFGPAPPGLTESTRSAGAHGRSPKVNWVVSSQAWVSWTQLSLNDIWPVVLFLWNIIKIIQHTKYRLNLTNHDQCYQQAEEGMKS